MLTLYYSPGSISLVPHIVLKELGLPHALERVVIAERQHHAPGYLKVNPRATLPALRRDDGQVLTETAAILQYIASLKPEAALQPRDPWLRARCQEWLSLVGTALNPAYSWFLRPESLVADESARVALRAAGRARFMATLRHCEASVPEDGWLLGADFSVADPYLAVMVLWARAIPERLDDMPRLHAWFRRVAARPSFAQALFAEGLIDASGKPTVPV